MKITTQLYCLQNLKESIPLAPNTDNEVEAVQQQRELVSNKKQSDTSAYIRLLKKPFASVAPDKEKLNNLLASGDRPAFHREWEAQKARCWLTTHDVSSKMATLKALILKCAAEEATTLLPAAVGNTALGVAASKAANFNHNLGQISRDVLAASDSDDPINLLNTFDDVVDAANSNTVSSWEICDSVADAISAMAKDYLGVFQQAVEKNAAFYRAFSDFMAKLKDFISAKDDKTILNVENFRKELNDLIEKYPTLESSLATTLYPVQDGEPLKGGNKDECEAWAREMGLDPAKCVKQLDGNRGYIVRIDTSPLDKIKSSLPDNDNPMECNSAQWAAWQSGLDIQKDSIQTGMQTLTQKYSNANSTFDNLVKVLSSTIASLLESDKSFFNI